MKDEELNFRAAVTKVDNGFLVEVLTRNYLRSRDELTASMIAATPGEVKEQLDRLFFSPPPADAKE